MTVFKKENLISAQNADKAVVGNLYYFMYDEDYSYYMSEKYAFRLRGVLPYEQNPDGMIFSSSNGLCFKYIYPVEEAIADADVVPEDIKPREFELDFNKLITCQSLSKAKIGQRYFFLTSISDIDTLNVGSYNEADILADITTIRSKDNTYIPFVSKSGDKAPFIYPAPLFDPNKVITPLNKERAVVGKRYWFNNSLLALKHNYERNAYSDIAIETLESINNTDYPFKGDIRNTAQFLYPVD